MLINPYKFDPCKARATLQSLHKRSKILSFEAKIDGARQLLGNLSDELTLTGRRTSVKTNQKLNKIEHFPALKEMISNMQNQGWLLDGELTHDKGFKTVMSIMNSLPENAFQEQVTHGPLNFIVFDCLHAPNVGDLRNEPLSTRRKFLAAFMKEVYDRWPDAHKYIAHVPVIDSYSKNEYDSFANFELKIEEVFDEAVSLGYEGLIVKSLDGLYNQQEWAKVKASETWDFVIIGYDDSESATYYGLGIAALQLGLYKDGVCYPVTKCSGMSDDWRRRFYEDKEKYLYKTVEIGGQLMFKETGAIRHPRFIRLRPDVDSTEQTFEKYGL